MLVQCHGSYASINNPMNHVWDAANALHTSCLQGPRYGTPLVTAVSFEAICGLEMRLLTQLFPPKVTPIKVMPPTKTVSLSQALGLAGSLLHDFLHQGHC